MSNNSPLISLKSISDNRIIRLFDYETRNIIIVLESHLDLRFAVETVNSGRGPWVPLRPQLEPLVHTDFDEVNRDHT